MKKMNKTIVKSFLILCFLFFVPNITFSEIIDEAKVYRYVIKSLTALPQDHEELTAELDKFTPQEKNEVARINRKIRLSEIRSQISEEEYQNWQKLEEVFLIAEDIAIKWYNMSLGDLPEDVLNEIMKEALSQYPETIELESSSSCPLLSYPIWYPRQDPQGAQIFFAASLMRVINVPGEWPCAYDLRFNIILRNHVWGLTQPARNLLNDFGGGVNGRNQPDHIHLIFGYWRTIWWLGLNPEPRLMQEIVVW